MREAVPSLTWEGARGDEWYGNNILMVCWKAGRGQTGWGLQYPAPTDGRDWEEAWCSRGLGRWEQPERIPEQKLCFLHAKGRLAAEALGQGRHDWKGRETDSCHPASHLQGRELCIQCFLPACFCLPLPHFPDPASFRGCQRATVSKNSFPRECLDGSLVVGNFIAGILQGACCPVGQCCIAKLSERRQWPTLLSCVVMKLVPHPAIAFFAEISPSSRWTFEISVGCSQTVGNCKFLF